MLNKGKNRCLFFLFLCKKKNSVAAYFWSIVSQKRLIMELIIALLISLGVINTPADINKQLLDDHQTEIQNNGIIVDDLDNI